MASPSLQNTFVLPAGGESQLPEEITTVSWESFVSDKFRKGKSRLEQAFYFQPTFS